MQFKACQVSKETLSKVLEHKVFDGVDETNLETLTREGPFAYTDTFIADKFYDRQVKRISELMTRQSAGEGDSVPEIWMICKSMVLPDDPYIPKGRLLPALILLSACDCPLHDNHASIYQKELQRVLELCKGKIDLPGQELEAFKFQWIEANAAERQNNGRSAEVKGESFKCRERSSVSQGGADKKSSGTK